MAKNSNQKSGKGILIVIILTLLALAAGVTSIMLLSQNRTLSQLFGGDSNVYESASLRNLSMNGEFIGNTISDSAKSQTALDADYQYMYRGVAYWVDDNLKITGLGFYSLEDIDGNPLSDIELSDIKYGEQKLETIADFEETFGLANVEKISDTSSLYSYFQSDYKLEILTENDVIKNVILKKDA